MVFGLTSIKVRPDQDSIAYETIQSIKGVKEIYRIYGECSFFLIMDAQRQDDLDKVVDEIRLKGGVVEIQPVLVTVDSDLGLEMPGRKLPAFS